MADTATPVREARSSGSQEAEDAWVAEQVAGGASFDGLFPMNADWRAKYETERADAPGGGEVPR